MVRLIFLILISLLSVNFTNADDLRDIIDASCRVRAGNAYGSGTAVHQDDQYIYIVTNAHVIGTQNTANLEFFKYGRKTAPITGSVVWKTPITQSVDFAIIRVEKNKFGDYPPNIIYFAPNDYDIKNSDYVVSAGCPLSRWLRLWEGYTVQSDDSKIIFRPSPDDGQSGSSLLTKINGELRIVGIVTGRNGEFQKDSNGFDLGYGVALRTSTLLKSYNKSNFNLISTQAEELYAKASDGNYYKQNPDGSVNVPKAALPVVEWNCRPRNGLVPLPGTPFNREPLEPLPRNPTNPNNQNPYGTLPPGFGSPAQQPQIEALQKSYDELQAKYNELLKENESLKQLLGDKDKIIEEINVKVESLTSTIKVEQEAKDSLLNDIETKNADIATRNEEIERLTISSTELNVTITNLLQQIEELKKQPPSESKPDDPIININEPQVDSTPDGPVINEDTTNTEDNNESIPSGIEDFLKNKLGILWSSIIAIGGTALWMKYKPIRVAVDLFKKFRKIKTVKDAAKQKYDDVTNVIQDHKSSIEKAAQSKIDGLSDFIIDKFKGLNSIAEKLSGIEDKVESIVNNGGSPASINNNVTITSGYDTANKSQEPIDEVKQVDPRTECSPQVNDRIKQFFDLKTKDGESLEQWAFFALLYKEAIQLLRQEKFNTSVGGKDTKLQGQRKTADAIDGWVRDQFLKRMSIDKLNMDYLYHEAMLGFLYKEAVERLRRGQFSVLGAKETANVIDNWVRIEFMKRMDIRLD